MDFHITDKTTDQIFFKYWRKMGV